MGLVTWGCWGREDCYLGEFLHEFREFLLIMSVPLCASFPPASNTWDQHGDFTCLGLELAASEMLSAVL